MLGSVYRRDLLQKILRLTESGDSALIIGASGIGKSAFAQALLDPSIQAEIIGKKAQKIIATGVNCDEFPLIKSTEFFHLLLKRFSESLSKTDLYTKEKPKLKEFFEEENELLLIEELKDLIKIVQNAPRRILFVIDGLDFLVDSFDAAFFRNLKSLRDLPRQSFSLIFLTKNEPTEPSVLNKIAPLTYLFSANIYYLTPLDEAETRQRIEELFFHRSVPPAPTTVKLLADLSGGYPFLIKVAVQYLTKNPKQTLESLIDELLKDSAVVTKLFELYNDLPNDEQTLLTQLAANGGAIAPDSEVSRRLNEKGILKEGRIFSPIFVEYVKRYSQPTETLPAAGDGDGTKRRLRIDPQTRRTYLEGQEIQNLTKQEFRLLNYLDANQGKIVSRDEVAEAVWETNEGVSEEAIDQLVTRLRAKIEKDKSNPQNLTTVRGRGFLYKP